MTNKQKKVVVSYTLIAVIQLNLGDEDKNFLFYISDSNKFVKELKIFIKELGNNEAVKFK